MAIPTPRAFDAVSPFRDVDGISHVLQTTGDRAAYLHVLYPVREAAQAAKLRALRLEAAAGDGGVACQVETGTHTDIFWMGGNSELIARDWRGSARAAWLRSPEQWAVFEATWLAHAGVAIFNIENAAGGARAVCMSPSEAGWQWEVEVTRQTTLMLNLPGASGEARMNGVRVQPLRSAAPGLRLLLPSPGRYAIELERQG
jgi:hypothetical protein